MPPAQPADSTREVLKDLQLKLAAYHEREDELRKALKVLGFEWLLNMKGLPASPQGTPRTSSP
ncbi:hypothetical protein RB595_001455 [Gaeumannomyces hyphopodioides]